MELRVLGPIELRIGGHWVDLGRGRTLALMVVMLGLNGGKPLPRESMLARIFNGDTSKPATLHTYVTRLRNLLQGAGAKRSVLAERSGSYSLAIDPENVDWLRFDRLHKEALRLEPTGDDDTVLAKLDEARELWRGEPLTGLSNRWALSMRETMRKVHRSVLADWGRIALRNRSPDELIGRLSEDMEQYPLDGPLTRNLMLALHEAGRTEEALAEYQSLRSRLAEAQGTDPDPQLQETFQLLLGPQTGGRTPDRHTKAGRPAKSERQRGDGSPARPMRDNLQRGVPDFSARAQEVAALLDAVRANTPTTTGVHVISGMPGVGKSALATHTGHLLRGDFPDARLHLDLHGNREHPPKDPMEALHQLLTMLGVPGQEVHPTLELRAAQWRDATSGLRALLILDDARDEDQVRWLLPGGPGCTVLVTSRHRMPELEGAREYRLDPPPPDEAVRMFATLAGQDPDDEHPRYAELVQRAECLPLALRLLANRWRRHPGWSLSDLIGQLEQARDRVSAFHAGRASLEAAFRVSLRALSPVARAAFVRLGLHPVPEFGAHAAAAVIGEPLDRTRAALDELADTSLVEEPWPHGYRMHALLAEFARGCAEEELSHLERFGATHRTMEYYLAVSVAADRAYLPHRHRLTSQHSYPVELPGIGSRDAAVRWFQRELPTLLAIMNHATRDGGFERHETGMAHALAELLDTYTPGGTAVEFHQRAVDIAARSGDHERLGQALLDLGKAQLRDGEPSSALHSAGTALHHWREAGDHVGRARTLDLIGLVHLRQGGFGHAWGNLQEALDLAQQEGHRTTMATALANLGVCMDHLGERQIARAHLDAAREMHREQGNIRAQAIAATSLSAVHHDLGENRVAITVANEAEDLLREIGDKRTLACLIGNMAEIKATAFEYDEALKLQLTALESLRELRDRSGVVQALCNVGRTYLALDDPASALPYLRESWEYATETAEHVNRAEILVGLGTAYRHLKNAGRSAECFNHALEAARYDGAAEEEAWALAGLAHLASQDGVPQRARTLFLEGRSVLDQTGHPDAVVLGILADIAIDDDLREVLLTES
ncbi:DNA-binding SARP family transcriptional activator [Lipingzhangella halophila]|uniref:DNA-binding SARP family transcriptional activator n=1 Tax=Lipingzhangella halophila TaxID=1783352 RepID=A0A7W7W548_9ACTN|nr:tetratricopeptide repeat protein [Lipingzhangella halophila]MBB4933390.1 DNA-binding SARP family transcriptional activator [Lipingzhangella halophila]